MDNEFILRQPGDKPCVMIGGTVSHAIVKDNVFRKESTHLTFTDAEHEIETHPSRYMLYAEDDPERRNITNATPAVAVSVEPFSPNVRLVQDNIICGWNDAVVARNTSPQNKMSFVVTGNTSDGRLTVEGPEDRTLTKVADNVELPKGLMP